MRTLGNNGPSVSDIGLGCMGMSDLYGPADDTESVATIHAALDAGLTLLDTGDYCGMGHNELLIRDALKGRNRGQVVISVKCGALRDPDVILECGSAWIVLGHLQRGSVAVQAGQVMEPGHVLGRVGNSGNTGEPHLHVHAQRPGSTIAPLSGEPVPIRLGGRYLVRNDRVHSHREGS